jgi:Tol biopolymer transport system component
MNAPLRTCTLFLVLALAAVIAVSAAVGSSREMNGRIAFTRGGNISTVSPDGAGLRNVTMTFKDCGCYPSANNGISWSPSGRDLLFIGWFGGGGNQIVSSRADGSGATNLSAGCVHLAPNGCGDADPVYSPDGTSIAFAQVVGTTHGNSFAIFTMNANGTDPTQLTTPSGWNDRQPAWSPNGKEIAFVRTHKTSNESAIEVMNADGSNIRRLTLFNLDAGDPHWSPNGKRILYSTHTLSTGKPGNLYTMRPDGTDRVALTHYTKRSVRALAEAWSPDGTQILFNRIAGRNGHFYIMNLRARDTRELTVDRTRAYDRAAWASSPG